MCSDELCNGNELQYGKPCGCRNMCIGHLQDYKLCHKLPSLRNSRWQQLRIQQQYGMCCDELGIDDGLYCAFKRCDSHM